MRNALAVLIFLASIPSFADATFRLEGSKIFLDYVMNLDNADFFEVPTFSIDGSFKAHLRKTSVPVDAPACLSTIEVAMPQTKAKAKNAEAEIHAKKALFDKIMELRESITVKEVKFTIDLTGDAKVISRDPLKLRLKRCKMTFARSMFNT